MKYFPSLLVGVVFLALLQESVIVAASSRQLSLANKSLRLHGDSRGVGDIEIGIAPSINTIPPNEPTFACPTPDGFFAIPNTCTEDYYVCVSGSPYVSICPNGNIFDPVTQICTPPANASCKKPVFTCPTSDGFYPIPGACSNSYYACVGNVPYVQNCPGTSIFDPVARKCVPPASASCTVATSTTTATTTVTTPTMSTIKSTTSTPLITTPKTTTTSPTITTTPTTTTLMVTTPTTTKPTTTTPITTTPTTTTPTTTTPTTTTPTTRTPTTTTPTTTTPTTTTSTTTTPTTTTPTTTTPTTTTPTTTTPTPTTPTTTTTKSTTTASTTTTTTTSTTTKPTTTTTVSTTSTTTPTTTKPTTPSSTTVRPFTCSQSHGSFPVPGVSCSTQYYMCSNYYAYLMDCAAPTVYNPALQGCDWSYNVAGCNTMQMSFKSWKRNI